MTGRSLVRPKRLWTRRDRWDAPDPGSLSLDQSHTVGRQFDGSVRLRFGQEIGTGRQTGDRLRLGRVIEHEPIGRATLFPDGDLHVRMGGREWGDRPLIGQAVDELFCGIGDGERGKIPGLSLDRPGAGSGRRARWPDGRPRSHGLNARWRPPRLRSVRASRRRQD